MKFERKPDLIDQEHLTNQVLLHIQNDEGDYIFYRDFLRCYKQKSMQAFDAAFLLFKMHPEGMPFMKNVAQMCFVRWDEVANFFTAELNEMKGVTKQDLPF